MNGSLKLIQALITVNRITCLVLIRLITSELQSRSCNSNHQYKLGVFPENLITISFLKFCSIVLHWNIIKRRDFSQYLDHRMIDSNIILVIFNCACICDTLCFTDRVITRQLSIYSIIDFNRCILAMYAAND